MPNAFFCRFGNFSKIDFQCSRNSDRFIGKTLILMVFCKFMRATFTTRPRNHEIWTRNFEKIEYFPAPTQNSGSEFCILRISREIRTGNSKIPFPGGKGAREPGGCIYGCNHPAPTPPRKRILKFPVHISREIRKTQNSEPEFRVGAAKYSIFSKFRV